MRFSQRFLTIVAIGALLFSSDVAAEVGGAAGIQVNGLRVNPAVSSSDQRVGINVDDLAKSSAVIFTDVMKQASPWTSDRQLVTAEDGNILHLAAGQVAQTVTLQNAAYPSGDYTLLWDGSGTFKVDARSGTLTQSANGRAIVHVNARVGYGIHLDLTSTNPRNYVRNVHLIVPGFATSYRTQVFMPAFLAQLRSFHVLRFVNWSHADSLASSAAWPQRPVVARFTQAGSAGVALEYQIALANAVGADPWFVIPAGATNFYITQTAALVAARLNPGLHPAFEYTSEAWRSGTSTNAYSTMAGRNFKLAADAQTAAVIWYAKRSTQMFGIVQEVFGRDAGRVTRVLSGPLALPNTTADAVDRMILSNAGGPRRADVFAVDATLATPAAIAYTRSLLSNDPALIASGGVGSALDAWHAAGGALFVASSVPAGVAAAQFSALSRYAQGHPEPHSVAMAPAAAVEPAPDMLATTYIPAAGSPAAAAAEAAATRTHAATVRTASSATSATSDMLQFHAGSSNPTLRTGWNATEAKLNTTTVASSKFGLRQTLNVDGLVLAQPLYVSNYSIGGTSHNLLVVATESDFIYVFDADSGALIWHRNYGIAQSSADIGCGDIVPSYGISSTPAIDRSTGTLYFVVASEPTPKVYHTRLLAVDLGSGNNRATPVTIAASKVMSNGSTIAYDPYHNFQRASLLLANNSLYVGAGSHCDHGDTAISGWLMRYSTSNLQQLAAFNTIEDTVSAGTVELGAIWGAGFGPVADTQGNVYAVTGNGAFDASSSGHNYAMSVLRFAPDLSGGVRDWFAYANEYNDSKVDLDFGSGGMMLLPTQSASTPNMLVAMGKSGRSYLLNQAHLGGYSSNDGGALSALSIRSNVSDSHGLWGGPAFYQGPAGPTIFYQSNQTPMNAYTVTSSSKMQYASIGDTVSGYGGSIPVVSSNGQASGSGIVWAVRRVHYKSANATEMLDAYDATNVSHHIFAAYSGTWSKTDDTEFVAPLVANGKVYVGAYKTVTVFGLSP